jgi:hypothetical protein
MKDPSTYHYQSQGRAFGPLGKGLVIADSIENYNNELSEYLTQKAVKANIEERETGYKPYIAPALSSGCFSVISTIEGKWHYSSTFMGGIFMGSKNRLTDSGIEIERLSMPDLLIKRLKKTYNDLGEIL